MKKSQAQSPKKSNKFKRTTKTVKIENHQVLSQIGDNVQQSQGTKSMINSQAGSSDKLNAQADPQKKQSVSSFNSSPSSKFKEESLSDNDRSIDQTDRWKEEFREQLRALNRGYKTMRIELDAFYEAQGLMKKDICTSSEEIQLKMNSVLNKEESLRKKEENIQRIIEEKSQMDRQIQNLGRKLEQQTRSSLEYRQNNQDLSQQMEKIHQFLLNILMKNNKKSIQSHQKLPIDKRIIEKIEALEKLAQDLTTQRDQQKRIKQDKIKTLRQREYDVGTQKIKIKQLNQKITFQEQNIVNLEANQLKINNDWATRLSEVQKRLQSKEAELNTMKSKYQRQIEDKDQQIRLNKAEIVEKTSILSRFQVDIASLKVELASSQKKIEDFQQQQQHLQKLVASQRQELGVMKQQIAEKASELQKIASELETKTSELKKITSEMEKTNVKLEKTSSEHQKTSALLQKREEELTNVNKQLANKLNQIMKLQSDKKIQDDKLQQKQLAFQQLQNEKEKMLDEHAVNFEEQKQQYKNDLDRIKSSLEKQIRTDFQNYQKMQQAVISEKNSENNRLKHLLQAKEKEILTKQQDLIHFQSRVSFTEQSLQKANKLIKTLKEESLKREQCLKNQLENCKKIEDFLTSTSNARYQSQKKQLQMKFEKQIYELRQKSSTHIKEISENNLQQIAQIRSAHAIEIEKYKDGIDNVKFQKQVGFQKLEEENNKTKLGVGKAQEQTKTILLYYQRKEAEQAENEAERGENLLANLERIMKKGKMKNEERVQYLNTIKQIAEQLTESLFKLEQTKTALAAEANRTYLLGLKLTERDDTINQMQEGLRVESFKNEKDIAEIKTYYEDQLQTQYQNAAEASAQLINHYEYLLKAKDQTLHQTTDYYQSQLEKMKARAQFRGEMEPLNAAKVNQQMKSYEIKMRFMEEDMKELEVKKDEQIRVLTSRIAEIEKELQESQKTNDCKSQKIYKLEESIRCSLQLISEIEQKSQSQSLSVLAQTLDAVSNLELSLALKLLLTSLSRREEQMKEDLRVAASREADLQSRLQQLRIEKDSSQAEISKINNQLGATKSMLNSLSERQAASQREKGELVVAKKTIEESLKEAEKKLQSSTLQISKLQAQLSAKTREIEDLKMVNLLVAQSKQKNESEAAQMAAQTASLSAKNSELEANLKAEVKKNADFSQKIDQMAVLMAKIKEETQNQLQTIRSEREEYREECEKNIEATVEADRRNIEQNEEIKTLKEEQFRLNALLLQTKSSKDTAEAEAATLKAKIAKLQQPSPTVRRATSPVQSRDVIKMKTQIDDLTKSQRCLKDEVQRLKAQLRSTASKSKIPTNDEEDESYYKTMLVLKQQEVEELTKERDDALKEIETLKEKLKKHEENSRNIAPLSPRSSRPVVSFVSFKDERSPIKEEVKPEEPFFKADSMFTPFPEGGKILTERLKKSVRSDIESIDMVFRMGEGSNSFSALFAKSELFERSFIFVFTAKNSRTFGLTIFREFAKSKHSALIFCLNPPAIVDKKIMPDERGSIAKMEGGELTFDSGMFRIRPNSKVLYFKESYAKYFGKLNKSELFGPAYNKETIDFELAHFEIYRVNFK